MTVTKNIIFTLTPNDIKEIIAVHMSKEFDKIIAPSDVQLEIINQPTFHDGVQLENKIVSCTICYKESEYVK